MNIFQATVKFIGWLSGSLAGIAALLTFFGYLVTAAHLKLLGLDITLFGLSGEYYLQRGGNFVFYVIDTLSQRILLPLMVIALLPLIIILIVDLFSEQGRLRSWLKSIQQKLAATCVQQATHLKICGLLLLVLLLFLQLGPSVDSLINPLKISDLLYRVSTAESDASIDDCIFLALVNQQQNVLAANFFYLIIAMLRAGLYLSIVWYISKNVKFRIILNLPFFMIFLLYLVFLPMDYGVMLIKSEFPLVTFITKKAEKFQQENYFLLNKTDKAFMLWDDANNKMMWVPVSEVARIDIGRNQPLWQKTINRSCHATS